MYNQQSKINLTFTKCPSGNRHGSGGLSEFGSRQVKMLFVWTANEHLWIRREEALNFCPLKLNALERMFCF